MLVEDVERAGGFWPLGTFEVVGCRGVRGGHSVDSRPSGDLCQAPFDEA